MKVEIGKGLSFEVDTEALREHKLVWDHVVYIGARNIFMDAHASVKREDFEDGEEGTAKWREASLALATKRHESMCRGELRTAHSGPRASHVDPIAAEALRLARTFVYGRARGWEKGTESAVLYIDALCAALEMPLQSKPKDILNAAVAKRAAREDVLDMAKVNVESAKKIAINVDDLGI